MTTANQLEEFSSIIIDSADRVLRDATHAENGMINAVLWHNLVELGVHKLLASEKDGGGGNVFSAAAGVANRLGAYAVSTPLIETMVANWVRSNCGLPVTDSPSSIIFSEETGAFINELSGLRIQRPVVIPWHPDTSTLLIVGHSHIAIVEGKLDGAAGHNLAGEKTTTINQNEIPKHVALSPIPSDLARTAFDLYALLKAAALAGCIDAVLAMSIDYANTRVQFGRPIAKFQAIQHMIAGISSHAVMAAASVQQAAVAFGAPHQSWYVALAKVTASAAAGDVASAVHQVHGAIGFTEEFTLHRFTKKLWTWRDEAGSEMAWQAKIGAAALRDDGGALWQCVTNGTVL